MLVADQPAFLGRERPNSHRDEIHVLPNTIHDARVRERCPFVLCPEIGVGIELQHRERALTEAVGVREDGWGRNAVLATEHDHELAGADQRVAGVPQLVQCFLGAGAREFECRQGMDSNRVGLGIERVVVHLEVP